MRIGNVVALLIGRKGPDFISSAPKGAQMVNKRDRLLHGRGVNERHGNDLRQYRVSVRRKRRPIPCFLCLERAGERRAGGQA